jgi:hypothetical protein
LWWVIEENNLKQEKEKENVKRKNKKKLEKEHRKLIFYNKIKKRMLAFWSQNM